MRVIFLVALFLAHTSSAQVILIKPNLANCVKCSIKIGSDFNVARTGIPTFLVFSTTAISDSSEIENALRSKELGMRLVFSDKVLRYFTAGSDVVYLNVDGKAALKKQLLSVGRADLEFIASDYTEKYKFTVAQSKQYRLIGDDLLTMDPQLGSTTVNSLSDTFKYKLTEEITNRIKRVMNDLYPEIFSTTDKYILEKPQYKFLMRPSSGRFSVYNHDVYMTVQVPFLYSYGPKSDTFGLQKLHAIVKFHKNTVSIHPIHIPNLVDPNFRPTGYKHTTDMPDFFIGLNCLPVNDSTVLFTLAHSEKPVLGTAQRFLGEFRLRKGVYQYTRQLDVDLPNLYKNKNIAYPDPYTYTSLWRADYPYFTTAIYPSLINLNTQETYDYQLPVNTNVADTAKLVIEESPLQNIFIYKDNVKSSVYIVSMLNGNKVLQVLSTANKPKLRKIIDLQSLGLDNLPYAYLQIVPEKDILYAADKDGFVRGYPLDLILSY